MTISTPLYTTATYDSDGQQSVAWPTGVAVGDLALLFTAPGKDGKPKSAAPSGWVLQATKSTGERLYSKITTASDIAAPIAVTARLAMLRTFRGAVGVGRVGTGESLSIGSGGAMYLVGWKATTDTLTASNKTDTTDVANPSWVESSNPRVYNSWFTAPTASGTTYIDTNAKYFFAVELMPATAPLAPTLIYPDGQYLDNQNPITFQWQHNSAGGGAQKAAVIRVRRYSGSTPGAWWYLSSASTYSTSTYIMVPLLTQYFTTTLPGTSGWTDVKMGYQILTFEDGGTMGGPYADEKFFTLCAKPTLTASTSGTGLSRLVTWAPTLTNGVQTWWRVRICAATDTSPETPLYDTGMVAGTDTSWPIVQALASLTNGASVKAWVEVGQTGGQQTVPTASAAFTVSWTPPAGPTSAAAQSGAPLRISASGLTVGQQMRVSFVAHGVEGGAVTDVPLSVTVPITATTQGMDVPLAPYGIPTTYTVQQSGLISGITMWSDPVTVIATSMDTRAYVVSDDLTDWLLVHTASDSDRGTTEGITISTGVGSRRPIKHQTPSAGQTGKSAFAVQSQAEKFALQAWMGDNPVFWLRWAPEQDVGSYVDVPPTRMTVSTPSAEERFVQRDAQARQVPFTWVEQ